MDTQLIDFLGKIFLQKINPMFVKVEVYDVY